MSDWRERSTRAAGLIPRGDLNQNAFKMSVVDAVRSREMRDRPMTEIVARATSIICAQVPGFVPTFPADLLRV